MTEITGGELLLRALHAENVKYVNAITDGTYMMFLEALERLGDEFGMQLIVPRHEAAGAHFADAYTRVTGEPAVAMACAGPGAANLISGVICAQGEGSPVVAITTTRRSEISDAYRHLGATQSPDHLALFRPAVKWNGKVEHWHRIPDMVRHAFRVAVAGNPGPVHLLIPEDILNQKGNVNQVNLWDATKTRCSDSPLANPDRVTEAAKMLVDAGPINLHLGGGAMRAGAGPQALALAEHLGCMVTSNISARGIIPEDHPLYFPPLCMASFMAHQQAEVVLSVGTRMAELTMWGKPPLWGDPAEQPTIQIELEPTNLALNRPVDIPLIGDAKAVLAQLLEAVKMLTPRREAPDNVLDLQMVRDQWWADLNKDMADLSRSPMLSGQIFQVCNEIFPQNSIMALDGGNTTMWGMHYHMPHQQRSMLYTANMGYLGTGLPYAIGAKLAAPDRPVYCVTGDSAFGFNIQELETAVRYNLPVVVIVAVDGAYGMEKTAQQRMFGREAEWFGHEHAPVRYDEVAAAMGCYAEIAHTAEELKPAIERAIAANRPAVIHAVVDPDANVDPPGMWIWTAARSGKLEM